MKISHIFLDFSSIQLYMKCRRKFYLSLAKSLEPAVIGDGSLAASFRGTLVHAALDARARKMDWVPIVDAMIEPEAALRNLDDSRSGSLKHIKSLIGAYHENYQTDGLEYVATEQTFQMPLSSRATYQGTVDKIVRDSSGLGVMDHKCSSSLRSYVEPSIAISDQFTGYIALAQASGFATNRLVVDGISTALKALNDGEGLFVRYETERTAEQIDNFMDRMANVADEIIDFIEHNTLLGESISLPTPACNEFNSKCQFLEVCSAGISGANVLKNVFRKSLNPWKNFRIIQEEV